MSYKKILSKILDKFYKPFVIRYLSVERVYTFKGLKLIIHPEVFHPGFFFSTKLLLSKICEFNLHKIRLLELGAGSGLISFVAAQKGAIVTASDINHNAVTFLQKNSDFNQIHLNIIKSDLFTNIPRQSFDFIVINPPYYFKNPSNIKEYAWFCGENGEYFNDLFAGIGNYLNQSTVILMILCDGTNLKTIEQIALAHHFELNCIKKHWNLVENNYIFQIRNSM